MMKRVGKDNTQSKKKRDYSVEKKTRRLYGLTDRNRVIFRYFRGK